MAPDARYSLRPRLPTKKKVTDFFSRRNKFVDDHAYLDTDWDWMLELLAFDIE